VPPNEWRATDGPLAQERTGAAAILLANGTVLIAGGLDADDAASATVERFTTSGAFIATPPMH
jgi:hypothetical protein